MIPLPLPFKNVTAETMPPGALFVIGPGGIDVATGAAQAIKVTVDNDPTFYVNGPTSVEAGGFGNGTAAAVCQVAYNPGVPIIPPAGSEVGPKAGSWYPIAGGKGIIVETLGTAGFFNAFRIGGKPVSNVGALRLTEDPSTIPESWIARTVSAGGVWSDVAGVTGTNNAWWFGLLPRKLHTALYWEEPIASGRYAFVPLQIADRQQRTGTSPPIYDYYVGFVGGDQHWAGVKTFADAAEFPAGLNATGALTISVPTGFAALEVIGGASFGGSFSVAGSVTCDNLTTGVVQIGSTLTIAGGFVTPTAPPVIFVNLSMPGAIECERLTVQDFYGTVQIGSKLYAGNNYAAITIEDCDLINVGGGLIFSGPGGGDATLSVICHAADEGNWNLGGYGGLYATGGPHPPLYADRNWIKVYGGMIVFVGGDLAGFGANTFTGDQVIIGGLDVSGLVSAGSLAGDFNPTDVQNALYIIGGVDLSLG